MVSVNGNLYNDLYGFNHDNRPTMPWELSPDQRASAQQAMQLGYGSPTGGSGSTATNGGGSAQSASDAMFDNVSRLTEGRANEIKSDPVNAEIVKYLQGIMGGGSVPYNDQTLNALKAQFGKGTASAEEAQMEALRNSLGAGGGSIYDPSYQAAAREQESQRQGQNLDYSGQLNTQANVANFNARNQAAAQLANVNAGQNSMINNLDLAGAGYQSQRFQEQPSAGGLPTTLMPQYAPQPAAPAAAGTKPTAQGTATQTASAKMTAPQMPTGGEQGSAQVATAPTLSNAGWGQKAAVQSYGPTADQIPDYLKDLLKNGGTARWA